MTSDNASLQQSLDVDSMQIGMHRRSDFYRRPNSSAAATKRVLLLSVAIVLFATGCASTDDKATESAEPTSLDTSISQAESSGVESSAAGRGTSIVGRNQYAPDAPPGSPLGQRVIYFEFDSATVPSQYRPVVEAHAEYLRERPRLIVTLEGHADELGTREYNIALGDRRGQAVRRLMQFQGAETAQLEVVSFGEETPAVAGQDESALSKNRRVEIVYSGERQ